MYDIFYCMNPKQVLKISKNKLFEIGSHMQSHPNIEKCSEKEIINELNQSKLFLENIIKKEVKLFCYPNGIYNRRSIELVKEAGYKAAFAEQSIFDKKSIFEIPRIGIYNSNSHYLNVKLSKISNFIKIVS